MFSRPGGQVSLRLTDLRHVLIKRTLQLIYDRGPQTDGCSTLLERSSSLLGVNERLPSHFNPNQPEKRYQAPFEIR